MESKIIILRRDYLEIVKNNFCAAKLISYFENWRRWKMQVQRTEWIYQPLRKIYQDLMCEHSIHKIRDALARLIDLGILERRENPRNKQDKTYQYRLAVEKLSSLLESWSVRTDNSKVNVEQQTHNQIQEYIEVTTTSDVVVSENTEENVDNEAKPRFDKEDSPQPSTVPQDLNPNSWEEITALGAEELSAPECKEILREVREKLNISLSPRLQRLVLNCAINDVRDAIAYVLERKDTATEIKSVSGYFVRALKEGWKPAKLNQYGQREINPPSPEYRKRLEELYQQRRIIRIWEQSGKEGFLTLVLPQGSLDPIPWWEALQKFEAGGK